MNRRRSSVIAGVGVVVLSVLSASGAVAATPTAGLWYYSTYHVQAAHDAGWTGKGVTVAVIDTQINPQVPTLAKANLVIEPSECYDKSGTLVPPTSTSQAAFHATNVVSTIVGSGAGYAGQTGVLGVAPGAKVLFYLLAPVNAGSNAFLDCYSSHSKQIDTAADDINAAVKAGANIISMSVGDRLSAPLLLAIANAEHHGVVILGALSNNNVAGVGDGSTPATSNGVVSVQAVDDAAALQSVNGAPNIDLNTDVVGPGVGILTQGNDLAGGSFTPQILSNGTSFATPIVAGFLALVKQKYPSATGNQLIQSLITNTGVADHALSYGKDGFGYGTASATHMLSVNPAKYPDANPLIATGANAADPSASTIKNPPTLAQYLSDLGNNSGSSSGSSSTPTAGKTNQSGAGPLLVAVIVLGVLIVLGVVARVIVLVRRRTRHDSISKRAR